MHISDENRPKASESGNILIIILVAILLTGLLTAAIQMTSRSEGSNIDKEALSLKTTSVREYMTELEHAIQLIQRNGVSESDIRFAHPDADSDYGNLGADGDPSDQVFHRDGGAAEYRNAPDGLQVSAAPWEFYGGSNLPYVGSDKPDLIAVLPNVTKQFCDKINKMNGLDTDTQPEDKGATPAAGISAGDCLNVGALGRFDDARQFYDVANANDVQDDVATFVDATTGAQVTRPVIQGCVLCETDSDYHFFHVLKSR